MHKLAALAVTLTVGALVACGASAQAGGITNAQAIAALHGHALFPSAVDGGKVKPFPVKWRPYALRVYRSGPYRKPAMNLFYAFGAAFGHFASKKEKADLSTLIVFLGKDGLADQFAKSIHKPKTVTRYGLTVRQWAIAIVRGIVAGNL